jgi:hypothetical protein
MSPFSRRKLIAAVAAAPLIEASAQRGQGKQRASAGDPVIAKARGWIVAKESQDALVRQWQDLESRLCERIRPLGLGLTQASRSALPEARQMRSLMRKIRLVDHRLDRAAGRLVPLRAKSPEGALAKIEMGLRIQEPLDCEEYAWALLRGGFEELSSFLRDPSALLGP